MWKHFQVWNCLNSDFSNAVAPARTLIVSLKIILAVTFSAADGRLTHTLLRPPGLREVGQQGPGPPKGWWPWCREAALGKGSILCFDSSAMRIMWALTFVILTKSVCPKGRVALQVDKDLKNFTNVRWWVKLVLFHHGGGVICRPPRWGTWHIEATCFESLMLNISS